MRTADDIISLYQQAMVAKDADALASLYSEDAIHEFPFHAPGHTQPLRGRTAIRGHYAPAWARTPVELDAVDTVAMHATTDPEVSIVEQAIRGRVPATGRDLSMGGVLVMRVRDGEIVHMRDYIDSLGALIAMDRFPAR